PKDAFHEHLIAGNKAAVNPEKKGTKVAAHYQLPVGAKDAVSIRLRLVAGVSARPFGDFDSVFPRRRDEADEFYGDLQKDIEDPDARLVQRQALAGMIWSKQFFYYDVPEWLAGDPSQPSPPGERRYGRNREWLHLNNADIISMPDKWEYPWYAAW